MITREHVAEIENKTRYQSKSFGMRSATVELNLSLVEYAGGIPIHLRIHL